MKIFLVHGDPFSLNIYKDELENSGYTDISMHHSTQACISHLSEKPDVVFLDHNMEETDGVELIKKIRHQHCETYVVIVPGRRPMSSPQRTMNHGAYEQILNGDNELRCMKLILRQISDEGSGRDSFFVRLRRSYSPLMLFISALLVLQSGVLAYCYGSPLAAVLVMMIVFSVIFTGNYVQRR